MTPRVSVKEINERLETIRKLMASGFADRDIVHRCSQQWGLSYQSVKKRYLPKARALHRQRANLTRWQAKGRSLDFWARRLQKFIGKEAMIEQETAKLEQRVKEMEGEFDAAETDEGKCAFAAELSRLQKERQRLQTALRSAVTDVHGIGDRMDRIYGTYAPTRIAETDSEGNDKQQTPAQLAVHLHQLGVSVPVLPETDGQLCIETTADVIEMPRLSAEEESGSDD